MSEIKREPMSMHQDRRDKDCHDYSTIYCFDNDHTVADIMRWLVDMDIHEKIVSLAYLDYGISIDSDGKMQWGNVVAPEQTGPTAEERHKDALKSLEEKIYKSLEKNPSDWTYLPVKSCIQHMESAIKISAAGEAYLDGCLLMYIDIHHEFEDGRTPRCLMNELHKEIATLLMESAIVDL